MLVVFAVAANGQHRVSTGATDFIPDVPPQVRLSTGAPLGNCDLTLYQSLGNSAPQPASPASRVVEAAKFDTKQLSGLEGSEHKSLPHEGRDLSAEAFHLVNHQNLSFQAEKQQNAEKENLLKHLCIPRFNMIEASPSVCHCDLLLSQAPTVLPCCRELLFWLSKAS